MQVTRFQRAGLTAPVALTEVCDQISNVVPQPPPDDQPAVDAIDGSPDAAQASIHDAAVPRVPAPPPARRRGARGNSTAVEHPAAALVPDNPEMPAAGNEEASPGTAVVGPADNASAAVATEAVAPAAIAPARIRDVFTAAPQVVATQVPGQTHPLADVPAAPADAPPLPVLTQDAAHAGSQEHAKAPATATQSQRKKRKPPAPAPGPTRRTQRKRGA